MKVQQIKHPFYCYKKKCRKTAWDTPEYLTPKDWETVGRVIHVLENNLGAGEFIKAAYPEHDETAFFYKAIGWSEGFVYCQEPNYVVRTAIPGLIQHNLAKLKEAYAANKNN